MISLSTRRIAAVGLLALAALLMAPLTASAAMNVYLELTLNGTAIEGTQTQIVPGRENDIECVSFSLAGFSDASRLPLGPRSYRPVTIMKRIDQTAPILAQAWAQRWNDGQAVFRFFRPNPDTGETEHYYTITLQNPQVASIATSTANTLDPANASLPDLQTVSFVFERILYRDEISGAEFADDPSTN